LKSSPIVLCGVPKGRAESAGINRQRVRDEKAPHKRRSCSIMATSHEAVADGDDDIQVEELCLAGFPVGGSSCKVCTDCGSVQKGLGDPFLFAFSKDISKVLGNNRTSSTKQAGHLILRQPDGFLFYSHIQSGRAIVRLINNHIHQFPFAPKMEKSGKVAFFCSSFPLGANLFTFFPKSGKPLCTRIHYTKSSVDGRKHCNGLLLTRSRQDKRTC